MADEDEEFLLRHEVAEELKRLATHPIKEIERLEEEAREGKTAASLGVVLAGAASGCGQSPPSCSRSSRSRSGSSYVDFLNMLVEVLWAVRQ